MCDWFNILENVTTLTGCGTTGSNDGYHTAACFDGVRGLALQGDGWLYLADTNNHVIRRMNTVAGSGWFLDSFVVVELCHL